MIVSDIMRKVIMLMLLTILFLSCQKSPIPPTIRTVNFHSLVEQDTVLVKIKSSEFTLIPYSIYIRPFSVIGDIYEVYRLRDMKYLYSDIIREETDYIYSHYR